MERVLSESPGTQADHFQSDIINVIEVFVSLSLPGAGLWGRDSGLFAVTDYLPLDYSTMPCAGLSLLFGGPAHKLF